MLFSEEYLSKEKCLEIYWALIDGAWQHEDK